MYNLGEQFRNKNEERLKALPKTVFTGGKFRITVLTERLVRLEYDNDGIFNDYATALVKNRLFPMPTFTVKEDTNLLCIDTKYFHLTYLKNTAFSSKSLYATIPDSKNEWYYGLKEVRNFGSNTVSLDNTKVLPKLENGLFSEDGIVTIDESNALWLDTYDNIVETGDHKRIDLYLFIYNNDFGLCLQDFYHLTGYPDLIPRYALGNWWSKEEVYNDQTLTETIDRFTRHGIPLSVFLFDNDWSIKDKVKYPLVDSGFTFNTELFPTPEQTIEKLHQRKLKVGVKINPYYGFYPFERYFSEATKYIQVNKQGFIEFNPFDVRNMDLFLKIFIHPLESIGIDFFWNDYLSKDKNQMFIVNDYMHLDARRNNKRSLMLMRNTTIAQHRYNVMYSGRTCIDWNTLRMLPFYNLSSSNIGACWWSHDVGGCVGGIEDNDFYIRSVQFGVFSPILRFNTERGKYFKREPWRWDAVTENIATYYLRLRHKLIPYIYSEAYRYHKDGALLIRPFYYTNLNVYDDVNYRNQYYFGNSFMISPIINPMDPVISNRTIQKFYMPDGVWYDFKTGKKFLGNHKYISFYKIEDYPIFVKTGSIIPLAGDASYMKMSNPTDLEIHVFPGKSNTYHLYEDDGETYEYQKGNYLITEIDYNYRQSNYTIIIRPLEGTTAVVPAKRNYKIVFRNTKKADNVVVYENDKKISRDTSLTENDFIVTIRDISPSSQIVINCYGKDIETDALMLIKDDIESILSDLKIQTVLKDDIAAIIFNDEVSLGKKRIAIKKLKRKGLDPRSIKVFLKLLDYMDEANK